MSSPTPDRPQSSGSDDPPPPDPELPDPELPDPELPDPELPDPELPDPELPPDDESSRLSSGPEPGTESSEPTEVLGPPSPSPSSVRGDDPMLVDSGELGAVPVDAGAGLAGSEPSTVAIVVAVVTGVATVDVGSTVAAGTVETGPARGAGFCQIEGEVGAPRLGNKASRTA